MSLFDLQDVCIAIGSLPTLDLPMVVDVIGIYVLKGPYYRSDQIVDRSYDEVTLIGMNRIVSMTFRVVRTNQYNQDLGLIHSTNGNHLESPNEGSSIDHQVTIYLHAQNITMFPTNETCSKMMRRRFVVATGSPAASEFRRYCLLLVFELDLQRSYGLDEIVFDGCEGERQYRTLILPAGTIATMCRVVNYHSSWARQQQVELFDESGNPGSTAGRGFNPAGGAPRGG
ncbi:hypothetical protein F511_21620 [Dorcoceras hygrometricum]|uniref:Uncharacterized protein n=1 Tax=Dorcoceras hygrometricum TaxID=472368 RepID=A0A2Z7D589_9LAMI|nr:hypothetical protein F511_21620 [Dorcoceras hygrometricum]